MVSKIKLFKFIMLGFCILILAILALSVHKNTETNLLRTFLPQNIHNYEDIINVSDKMASTVKVVFEADNEENLELIKNEFIKNLDFDYFYINSPDISLLLKKYIDSPENFLSYKTKELLKQKKYNEVYSEALENLYNPTSLQLTTFDKDPYFLINDFLNENRRISEQNYNFNDKYYDYLSLKIKNNEGLSPELSNIKIDELVSLKTELSDDKCKIYLSGSPVHSYYTSKKSTAEINIICILSTLLILSLMYFYFKRIKTVIPVFLSIFAGMLTGYVATKLWFDNFQIITMVFSTTLIGIGIDYSCHYFFTKEKNKTFIKNLTFSIITTLIPFLLLYLTGIELLKQISVFTVFGLISIYIIVLIFYPCFDLTEPSKTIKLNPNYCKYTLIIVCVLSILGYLRINFNDSLTSLYLPTRELKKSENLYNKVSGEKNTNTRIITVQSGSFDELLQKEEKISEDLYKNNIDFVSISKFIPSESRQKENFELVQNLYNNNLNNFEEYLFPNQIQNLRNKVYAPVKFDIKKNDFLSGFLTDSNKSVMIVTGDKEFVLKAEGTNLINIKTDVEKYIKNYRMVLIKIFPAVIILLFLVLCFVYGFKNSVKILIPPVLGIITAAGMTCLILGELNLFSIIAIYMVIGFTMDYSIFRLKKENRTEDAILVSGLTTFFSFFLLSFCGFKLISSIALILMFGILTAYLSGYLLFGKQSNER